MSHRIIVRTPAEATAAVRAAAALGVTVTLVSAPGAGAYVGPDWFAALVRQAAFACPNATVTAAIDCADEAGTALAALRAGYRHIVFAGHADAEARLAEIAAQVGAVIERPGAPALDLLAVRDPEAACRTYLAGSGDDVAAARDAVAFNNRLAR